MTTGKSEEGTKTDVVGEEAGAGQEIEEAGAGREIKEAGVDQDPDFLKKLKFYLTQKNEEKT